MAKAGLDGLCKGMARDLGPKEITVNTVHPGPISTDANPEDGPYSKQLKSFMASPKFGKAEDVAGLVAYLVSDEAVFAMEANTHKDLNELLNQFQAWLPDGDRPIEAVARDWVRRSPPDAGTKHESRSDPPPAHSLR